MKCLTGIAVSLLVAAGVAGYAADEKKLGWSDTADFSYVFTSGNSSTNTFGFKNVLKRDWQDAAFTPRAGAVRSSSEVVTDKKAFVRSDGTVSIIEDKEKQTSAEFYFLNGQYDRNISENFYWFVGAGWERNELAGIANRYVVSAGVGNIWHNTDDMKFKTFYGVTWTNEKQVEVEVEIDGEIVIVRKSDSFVGVRGGYDYLNKLTASTTIGSVLIVDLDTSETSNWRGDWTNWVAVAINSRMALKAGLQLLYDNQPAIEFVPQFRRSIDRVPIPAGFVPDGAKEDPLDKLDSIFTTSLVINW
jgi:putative salt-induced outer membrane protein YdiY